MNSGLHSCVVRRTTFALATGWTLAFAWNTATPLEAAETQPVCDQVRREISRDPAIFGSTIDVSCEDGIITLTGTAPTLLAKERARKQGETVLGVEAVINRIDVQPLYARSDLLVRDDIKAALMTNLATESYEVGVAVNAGQATLTGTVDSWQERQLCAQVAKGVVGVRGVNNLLRLAYRPVRSDVEIKNEVRETFNRDVYLDGANHLSVIVVNGEVMLNGIVDSAFAKRRAARLSWVYGVTGVDDSGLRVVNLDGDAAFQSRRLADRRSDGEIEDAVEAVLAFDPRTKDFDLNASVENAVVTLEGAVDNLQAKRVAEQDARNTVGVTSVNNELNVRPAAAPSDAEIRRNIREALDRNAYTNDRDIAVSYSSGVARLNGTVNTQFEKATADDVASTVNGVTYVENHLEVPDPSSSNYVYDPYVDAYDPYHTFDWLNYTSPQPRTADARIEADIELELHWSPFVDSDDVTVSVDNGIATLSGTVDSWSQLQAASENAIEGGAVAVDNNLIVR